jgi:hypothetical protein
MHASSQCPANLRKDPFPRQIARDAGILVLIHLLPKGSTQFDYWRLLMTVVYFAAVLRLAFRLLQPRTEYVNRCFAWRYFDCPPTIARAWRKYDYALDRVITGIIWLAILALLKLGLGVLAAWFPELSGISTVASLIWWAAIILSILISGLQPIREAHQNREALTRELALIHDYRPRDWAEFWQDPPVAGPPVKVLGHEQFLAGGLEWHWGDFLPNCVVFGQSGSGKTVCVLNALLDGLLGATSDSAEPASALIMDPKGDFRDKIQLLCRRWGREDQLKIIDLDPHSGLPGLRWNPLDSTDDEIELASRFAAVLELNGMKDNQSSFWIDYSKKFLQHGLRLLRMTNEANNPPSFVQLGKLVSSVPYLAELVALLDERDPRCGACVDFFADEWLTLDHRLRTDVLAYISNMIHPFLQQPYETVFSGRSDLRIADMIDSGTILYLHMPTDRRPAMARTVGGLIKAEYFDEIRRRLNKTRPSFFFCDEFHEVSSFGNGKGDPTFFALSRQSNHANIVATQNIDSFQMLASQEAAVLNLLGNCAVKIFLRNEHRKTNQYASELYGQELVEVQGVQLAGGGSKGWGSGDASLTGGDQWVDVVRPEAFTQLHLPRREEQIDYCESIVHLGARSSIRKRALKARWTVHPIEGPAMTSALKSLALIPDFSA